VPVAVEEVGGGAASATGGRRTVLKGAMPSKVEFGDQRSGSLKLVRERRPMLGSGTPYRAIGWSKARLLFGLEANTARNQNCGYQV
jgi:hypothetical protein